MRVESRMRQLFERCPALWRFTVRDRASLPDHIDPTTLQGEIFVFEVALFPRYGQRQYDEVYRQIANALHEAIRAEPEQRRLLPGRSFVRALQ
jgi:hypothetical protein